MNLASVCFKIRARHRCECLITCQVPNEGGKNHEDGRRPQVNHLAMVAQMALKEMQNAINRCLTTVVYVKLLLLTSHLVFMSSELRLHCTRP